MDVGTPTKSSTGLRTLPPSQCSRSLSAQPAGGLSCLLGLAGREATACFGDAGKMEAILAKRLPPAGVESRLAGAGGRMRVDHHGDALPARGLEVGWDRASHVQPYLISG